MDTKQYILEKYNVPADAQIGGGMEAEVYEYDDDTVLKIYAGTATFDDLVILRNFYNSLERDLVYYELPNIYSVTQEHDHVVTIEQRLLGRPMSSVLGHLSNKDLDAAMQEYMSAVFALAKMNVPDDLVRLRLFDPNQWSKASCRDWNQFLLGYLKYKVPLVAPYLERDVARFSSQVEHLYAILETPYDGDYRLIHGDFCPGNVLIDDQHRASAIIDFGSFTMYGDHLFDVATGWVFFDMYDELKARIYDRLLAILLEAVGHDKRGILYRYILIYSILSANSYSADCTDGHYQWCIANLGNQDYWKHIS